MSHRSGDKMYRNQIDVRWMDDGYRFWYSVRTPEGVERYLVDPARNTKQLLIDRNLLAQGISSALDTVVEARNLTLNDFELSNDERSVSFSIGVKRLSCEVATNRCASAPAKPPVNRGLRRSPDGKWDALVRDNDIYIREVGCTGGSCETRLTTDGSKEWAYGRSGTFQSISLSRTGEPRIPMVAWSPDSRKMAVMRWDVRDVEKFYYISATTIRPELFAVPQAIPSDSVVERYDIYVIDIVDKSKIRINTEQIPWVRGGMTEGVGSSRFVEWAPTSDRFFFLSNDRGPSRLSLMTADAKTGASRRIVTDTNSFRFGAISEYVVGNSIWHLSRGNDVYWYSERDGGSHIYRYDSTGRYIGKVTEGTWNVMDAQADSTRSTFFVTGKGREANQFKGHTKLYRMRPDGSSLTLLTPEKGEHSTRISPDGRFFVDTYSSPDEPPVTVVRTTDNGRVIRELERTDLTNALALGWKPREIVTLTASDGVTPIYAAVFKPTNFDSTKRYPIVDHIYPMPLGSITSWGFFGPSSEQQALAELGFIVIHIQPRGVRDPSPAIRNYYRTQYQGRYGEATLADHVEAIKQLGARFSYIDLDKVGLYGTSGGGFSTTQGMLRYPDFFKVGVAFAGNHDDRSEHTIVGESWRGMLRTDSSGKDNYEGDANYLLVNNLRGKLMLVHGDLDEAVHPAMTTRVAAALIDAGKRFDMMVFPDQGHSSGGWYGSRLIFDYFVRHLMGYEVPEYTFTGVADPLERMRRRPLRTP